MVAERHSLQGADPAGGQSAKGILAPLRWSRNAVLTLGVTAALASAPAVGTLLASDIVVVSSSDLPIYKNVAGAIEPGPQSRVVNVTLPAGRNHDAAIHAVWEARPDAIVALGARALEMTAREFQGIPIVFGMVADTDEYARTGETAGVALIPSEAQMLKAIRKVLPGVSRVAIIFDPDRSSREAERFASTARGMGITSRPIEFAQDSDVQGVLRSLAGWCDCLVVLPDPILLSDEVFAEIVFRALSLGVPSVGYASAFARKGALISVETDYSQIGSDISGILRRVLEGARPGAIGVNAPSALKITVNQAVAEVLHLGISDGSLSAIEMIAVRPGSARSAGQPDGIPAAPVP